MLYKSFTASVFLLALTSSVSAQSQDPKGIVITPALGVSNPGASDVQHPSTNAPCGDKSISQNLGSSTPVQADTDGKFRVHVLNFGT